MSALGAPSLKGIVLFHVALVSVFIVIAVVQGCGIAVPIDTYTIYASIITGLMLIQTIYMIYYEFWIAKRTISRFNVLYISISAFSTIKFLISIFNYTLDESNLPWFLSDMLWSLIEVLYNSYIYLRSYALFFDDKMKQQIALMGTRLNYLFNFLTVIMSYLYHLVDNGNQSYLLGLRACYMTASSILVVLDLFYMYSFRSYLLHRELSNRNKEQDIICIFGIRALLVTFAGYVAFVFFLVFKGWITYGIVFTILNLVAWTLHFMKCEIDIVERTRTSGMKNTV